MIFVYEKIFVKGQRKYRDSSSLEQLRKNQLYFLYDEIEKEEGEGEAGKEEMLSATSVHIYKSYISYSKNVKAMSQNFQRDVYRF